MARVDDAHALIEHFLADIGALIRRDAVAAVERAFATGPEATTAGSALVKASDAPPVPRTETRVATSARAPTPRKAPAAQRRTARGRAAGRGDSAALEPAASSNGKGAAASVVTVGGEAATTSEAVTTSEATFVPPTDPTPADVQHAPVVKPPDPIVEKLIAYYRGEWRRGRRAGRTLAQLAETANVEVAELAPVVAALVDQGSLVRRDVTNDYAASKAWLRG